MEGGYHVLSASGIPSNMGAACPSLREVVASDPPPSLSLREEAHLSSPVSQHSIRLYR